MSLVRGLTEMGAKAAKKTAPFYSAVDEALANLKRPKGTGMEFLTEVMKTKGVKKAEIADRKLEEAFKAKGKMTKEEAQQVLKDNPPPKLQERVIDDTQRLDEEELKDIIAHEMFGKPYDQVYNQRERSRVFDEAQRRMDTENGTRYGDYKTPGGENYREILLKLPEAFNSKEMSRMLKLEADLRRGELPTNEMQELLALQSKKQNSPKAYQSSHWSDDPNVLAHMRVQDRIGPNGEKILHVEEIQSDWHQQGRKKGYKSDVNPEENKLLVKQWDALANERRDLERIVATGDDADPAVQNAVQRLVEVSNELNAVNDKLTQVRTTFREGVPDAPFKKNWHELAMKRLLNYAADNGYDSIAITPGAEQAKRYDLSKHLSRVAYREGRIQGYDHNGALVISKSVEPKDLPDFVGKELGAKMAENAQRDAEVRQAVRQAIKDDLPEDQIYALREQLNAIPDEYSGLDLTVGGEGMKGFYDKMLPDYLNNYGKQYGAQVQMDSVPVSTRDPKSTGWDGGQGDHPFMTSQDLSEPFDGMVELLRRNPETGEHELVGRMLRADSEARIASELMKLDKYNQIKLHNFPITPEMRESIKQKGLPLYQQIGIPTAGAGAASQALQPEEEQGLSGGGMVNSAIKQAHLAKLAKMRQEMAPRAEAIKNLIAKDANAYLRDVVPNSLTNPEIEAEIARMAARAKAAGQQEGVLPMAQRDANLAKFLEESKVKERLYHTTNKEFTSFNPNADVRENGMMFFSNEPFYHPDKEQTISMPVHVKIKKIFDPSKSIPKETVDWIEKNSDLIHKELSDYNNNRGLGFAENYFDPSKPLDPKKYIQRLKSSDWQSIEAVPSLVNHLKSTGHDAIKAYEEGLNTYGLFDPQKIKSSIGNRGTYDINDPDITKAMGGSVKRQVKKADGGAINYNTAPDMSDGGRIIQGAPFKHGGKVNMTANRDAMFMELSNKKLKRK